MEVAAPSPHNPVMTEYETSLIFERAVQLAYVAFREPSDAHVLGVFARLVWNRRCGADADGATTLH